ncbi:MAG: hypothetical protein IJU02_06920 [Lachnospiraceae bacterium]|nr:hypothetical protein [Lachnospiraceae bacterium]
MRKTKSKRMVVALCMATVAFCCVFVPMKNVEAAGGLMDRGTVFQKAMEEWNSYKAAESALMSISQEPVDPYRSPGNGLQYLVLRYHKTLYFCYSSIFEKMGKYGCNVVGINYTGNYYVGVTSFEAYAFDGSKQYQDLAKLP